MRGGRTTELLFRRVEGRIALAEMWHGEAVDGVENRVRLVRWVLVNEVRRARRS